MTPQISAGSHGLEVGASSGALCRAAAAMLAHVSDTPSLEAELLLAHSAGVSRASVLAHPEREVGAQAHTEFRTLVERRAQGEPFAYLVGRREFFGLDLEVSPAVLVPRPETELLVEEALAAGAASDHTGWRVLDLGTGSGAIALAIQHNRADWQVTGADVSAEALAVARRNSERLALPVEWLESDWFAGLETRRFDAVVCNPPYVMSGESQTGSLGFEPRRALDGGPSGLDALDSILRGAARHLAPGGRLYLEHGYDQRRAVLDLAAAADFHLVIAREDLAGRDRCVVLEPDM